MWSAFARDARQQREPFCRDLRIRQNIFDRGELCFRKKERVWVPVEQTFVEQFLRTHARTNNPKRARNVFGKRGHKKRLRRFRDMRERDGKVSRLDVTQFLRDGFRV